MTRLVADARQAGLLVILDAKRGDVGSTNDAYAEAYLGKGAPIAVDALTVHPYLGVGAMGSLVERADESGSCLLLVTRSTNPEGRIVQAAAGPTGRRVEEAVLDEIADLNRRLAPGRIGPVGAVVGPRRDTAELDLVAPQALYLAPGAGAQGATAEDVAEAFAACPDRVMPSASRSLLEAGPDVGRLRDGVVALAEEVRRLLGA